MKQKIEPADIIYTYDHSLPGFYNCIYDSVYLRQMPFDIQPAPGSFSLFPVRAVQSDIERAGKVRLSINNKIAPRALELVETVFFSCMEHKEMALLAFVLRGYRDGGHIVHSVGDRDIAALRKAENHLLHEAHLLTGFVRFSDQGGMLASTITPKNFVLPFFAEHFSLRFAEESFIIFDKTHKAALLHYKGNAQSQIVSLEAMELIPPSEEESRYQELWKRFYHTIAIEARENPRCRMTHMPKRYWENMTEMRDLLQPKALKSSNGTLHLP